MSLNNLLIIAAATLLVACGCPPVKMTGEINKSIAELAGGGAPGDEPAEFAPGTNGIWEVDKVGTDPEKAWAVVKKDASASPVWTETFVVRYADLSHFVTGATEVKWQNASESTGPILAGLGSGVDYWIGDTAYDYVNPPSASEIAALPGNISGSPFKVSNDDGTTPVVQGALFREDLGSNTYRDHWLLYSGYSFPTGGKTTHVIPDPSGKNNLKDFLQVWAGSSKWYVQNTYTLVKKTTP